MAEIVLDHVVKRYPDGALAVDDFNLEIADGEFIILVGPSGCGKSTTLNMVAGLEDITAGELIIDGTGGQRQGAQGPRHRHGVPVLRALPAHDRRREHGLPARCWPASTRAPSRSKVDEAAEMLELTQHLDRKPANLSGGQRQRVAMGRAIVRQPQGVPDGRAAVQPRRQAARADAHPGRRGSRRRLGTTTLYVTHDQTEAMTLGDRVVVMRGGVVQQVGSPTGPLRPPDQPVRGRVHRQPVDELPARRQLEGDGVVRPRSARPSCPTACRQAVERSQGQRRGHRGHPPRALRGRRAGRATSRARRSTRRSTSSRRWARTSTPTSP